MTHLKLKANGDYEFYSGPDGDVAKVSLSYYKDARVRGVYLSIRTVTLKREESYTSESFVIFQDKAVRALLAAIPRKSDKVIGALAAKVDALIPQLIAAYGIDKNAVIALLNENGVLA